MSDIRSEDVKPEDFSIEEENEDFRKSTIARSNLTNTFTLEDVEKHREELKKMKQQLESQIKVSGAVVDNVERNHDFVKDFSGEELTTLAYYKENLDVKKDAEDKLSDVEQSLDAYNEVIDVVYDKFGFVKSNIKTDGQETDKEE